MTSITSTSRPYTAEVPCPICGKHDGCRWHGLDMAWCVNVEDTWSASWEREKGGSTHLLGRKCDCGKTHTLPESQRRAKEESAARAAQRRASTNGSTAGKPGISATQTASGDEDEVVRIPITRVVRPWPVMGEAAYHGLAGNVVRAIEPTTEADPVGILVTFLLAFGSMTGRGAHVNVGAVKHYANEYALLVGDTSKARKGTATAVVRSLMHLVEKWWSNNCTGSGLQSGEGLIHAVRDPQQGVDKKTGEEITTDSGVLDKRLFLVQEEFSSVLTVSGRERSTLSETVREAWDGREVLRNLNKNSPEKATGAHVSLLGHITLDELRRHLTETETANGFANRFLFACVRRSKELPFGGRADLETIASPVIAALEFAQSLQGGAAPGEGAITWADTTRPLWRDAYSALSAPKRGLVGALTARAEAHVLRVALIYALLDRSHLILPKHLEAAMAVWRYGEDSCTYIFGDALGDPIASGILTMLEMMGEEGADRTAITRHFGNNISAGRLEAALALLLDRGSIIEYEERGKGRPRRVYVLAST